MSEKNVQVEVISTVVGYAILGVFGLIAVRLISEGMEKSIADLKDSIVAPFVDAGTALNDLGTNIGTTVTDVVETVDEVVTDTVKKTTNALDSLVSTGDVLGYAASQDYDLGAAPTVFKVINNSGDSAKKVVADLKKAVDIGVVWDAYEQAKTVKMDVAAAIQYATRTGQKGR